MTRDLWAIGDIHGCYDELLILLDTIESKSPRGAEIVFLGDYVDRGPKSLEVLRFLMAGAQRTQDKWIYLRGNHEQLMLDAIANNAVVSDCDFWLDNGGDATVNSFTGRDYKATNHRLVEPPYWFERQDGRIDPHKIESSVPEDIVAWARTLPYYHKTENHLFAHAGAERGLSAEEQDPYMLMWMRNWEIDPESYTIHGAKYQLDAPEVFDWHVVYGHTPRRDGPYLLEESSGLDTGAVYGHGLTGARFDRHLKAGPVQVHTIPTPNYYG